MEEGTTREMERYRRDIVLLKDAVQKLVSEKKELVTEKNALQESNTALQQRLKAAEDRAKKAEEKAQVRSFPFLFRRLFPFCYRARTHV